MRKPNDHLRDAFRIAGRRLTTQRRLVLEVLRESDKHLDAEALHDQVKTTHALTGTLGNGSGDIRLETDVGNITVTGF